MANIIKKNTILLLYQAAFLLVAFGVIAQSGSKYLYFLAVFYFTFMFCYTGVFVMLGKIKILGRAESITLLLSNRLSSRIIWTITGLVILLMIGHFVYLGINPSITALRSYDYYYIIKLRRDVTFMDSSFWRYVVSFMIRAIIPFIVLFGYANFKRKHFWFILAIMVLYSVSLLSKSYIITILLPVLIFSTLKNRLTDAARFSAIIVIALIALVVVANPSLRATQNQLVQDSPYKAKSVPTKIKVDDSKSSIRIATEAIGRRVFLVPGFVVAKWFECIPDSLPYLNGAGYRFIAKPLGLKFHNYPHELWPYIHPLYAAVGRKGTVNTASFMYDFANWGWKGLLISGLILGLFLAFVERLFGDNMVAKLSINATSIFWLTSTSLFTLLFSGGWGLMILLYALFGRNLTK
ncbi:MAG: hypothetical protein ACI9XB_004399 [Gammaproteobacteria bacterium]|jgi:hypothetical protein